MKHRWLSCLQSHYVQTKESSEVLLHYFRIYCLLSKRKDGGLQPKEDLNLENNHVFSQLYFGEGGSQKKKSNSTLTCITSNIGSLWPPLRYTLSSSGLSVFQLEHTSLGPMHLPSG